MGKIKFEIKDKTYVLPNKITIEKYVKFFKIKDILSEEYFDAKLVNIITGCPLEDLLMAEWEEVKYLSNQIQMLFPHDKTQFVETFELNGVEYGFITDWKEMSFAEYADADTLASKKPEEMLNYLHILAAIFYRPIVKKKSNDKYEIEPYDNKKMLERAELFKNELDVRIVVGAQFFFTLFAENSQRTTRLYSTLTIWEKMKLNWTLFKMIVISKAKGDLYGIQYLIDYQMTTLQNTMKSLENQSSKSSTNWSTSLKKIRTPKRLIKK